MLAIIVGLAMAVAVGWPPSIAQEAEYILAHDDVFGGLRRPAVAFSHERHEESLENGSCAACHHSPDDPSGKLAYIEGDERSCKECHELNKADDIPALREAFHGNCTHCHRKQIKSGNLKSGPTTCGGCHQKKVN
jgi:hypothetical protein